LNTLINTASSSDPSLFELYDSVSIGQEALLTTLLRLLTCQHIAIQEREKEQVQTKTVPSAPADTNIRIFNRELSEKKQQAEIRDDTTQATFILNGSSALLLFKSDLKSNTYLSLDFTTPSDCQRQLQSPEIQRLLPHIKQALSITDQITQQETELEAVNYVLDHYPIPSLAIDRQFNVIFSNQAAQTQLTLMTQELIDISSQSLARETVNLLSLCTQASQRQQLRQILTESQINDVPINHYLHLELSGQRIPLVISSRNKLPNAISHCSQGKLAWIYLLNQNYILALKKHSNFKRLKLSAAETELATHLFAGESLNDIAETRHVSKQTVRKQLQSVLRKTHCENQEELMLFFFEQCIHYSLIHADQ